MIKFTQKRIIVAFILALALAILIQTCTAMFPFGCMDGFYEDYDKCLPCDSSCKTCSNGTSCDTCEFFMFLNSGSSLCEHCPDEEYYDEVSDVCRPCATSCKGACIHQPTCYECPSDKVLDLDTMECVDTCETGKVEISSSQILMEKACKTYDIFIDHFSNEVVEFGTEQYPYRTMKAAVSEILNHYSHTDANITIYTKDVYFEVDIFFILNMTSVAIENHPFYQRLGENSNIIITSEAQAGISKKSRVHLLKHADVDPNEAITLGDYSENEESSLVPNMAAFSISRTNFRIKNLNFYSDDTSYVMYAYYLQEKEIRMENVYFNTSGAGLSSYDPYSLYIDGLRAEISKGREFIGPSHTICNYPEAATATTTYINNVTAERTIEDFEYMFLFQFSKQGNFTLKNLDCSRISSSNEVLNNCLNWSIRANCNPTDDLDQILILDNVTLDGNSIKKSNEFVYFAPFFSQISHTRKLDITASNFKCSNLNYESVYGFYYYWGSGTETVRLRNFMLQNISSIPLMVQALNYGNLIVENFYLEENINLQKKIFELSSAGNVDISNVYMTDYSNSGSSQSPAFEIMSQSDSVVKIHDIHLNNVEILSVPLLSIGTLAKTVTISDLSITDMKFADEGSLFYLQVANSFSFTNLTIQNATSTESSDSESVLFSIQTLDVTGMTTGEIKNISIENSAISLISVNSLQNLTNEERTMNFDTIEYVNSEITTSRSLISTDSISGDTNLTINLSNLKFENINFTGTGTILEMKHQLPNYANLSNSIFNKISSGSFSLTGSQSAGDTKTKLRIEGCSFINIHSPINPLMTFQQRCLVDFTNTLFTNLTSTTFVSGIMNIIDSAQVMVTGSNFTNNSAVSASIAKVETLAVLFLQNCNIYDNFAITNGVFEVASSGIISINDCKIYKNYAIQYPVGTIFLSVDSSNITNTEIHDNEMIMRSEIANKISSDCTNLCFLQQEMKDYLAIQDLSSTIEAEYIFQVLQGELSILDSTHIYNQTLIFSCFSATVLIENSKISDIKYDHQSLDILDSIFTMRNSEIVNAQRKTEDFSFIVVNSGDFTLQNVSYSDSNSQMFIALSSNLELVDLQFQNINYCPYLVSMLFCDSIYVKNITVRESNPSESIFMYAQNTKNVTIENTQMADSNYTLASFKNSGIELINNLQMTNMSQVLKFMNSNITLMKDSQFINNSYSGFGGAISLINSEAEVQNCTFEGNSANKGGAISFECTSLQNCRLAMENSIFRNNKATEEGGAIYYNYNYPRVTNITFHNNSAPYGDDLASYPARIGFVGSTNNDPISLNDIGPGLTIPQELRLALLDFNDQVMVLDNSSQINIVAKDPSISSINGINVIRVTNGIAVFDSISAQVDRVYDKVNFTISSKSIDYDKITEIKPSGFDQNDLLINFRDCQAGERILGNECQVCTAGTYSLYSNSSTCEDCALDADCLGGQGVSIRPGFWRRFHNSSKIAECINKNACEGGYNPDGESPVVCAIGYTGNLCSQCVITKDVKYERVNDFECAKCPAPFINAIRVIVLMLLMFSFLSLMVIINVRKTTESELSVIWRILANYFQLIVVSISMTTRYPSAITSLIIPMKMFGGSSDVFLSFDCFFMDTEITLFFDSNVMLKLFLLGLLPLFLFLIFVIIWTIVYYVKRDWIKDFKKNLVVSFITIVFLLHPTLAEKSISIFRCVEIDDGYSVSRMDTDIECMSHKHLNYAFLVAFPIIIFWVLLCPILGLLAIYIGKNNPKYSMLKDYLLVLYQGLKPEAIYWEFTNTLRKIALLLFLLLKQSTAISLSIIMLVFTAKLQAWLKPYKNPDHYKVEFLAMIAGVCTVISALILSQNEQHDSLNSVIFACVIIINVKFLTEWIFLLLLLYKGENKIHELVVKMFRKLLRKEDRVRSNGNKKSLKDTTSLKERNKPKKTTPKIPIHPHKKRLKKIRKLKKRKHKITKPPHSKSILSTPDNASTEKNLREESKKTEKVFKFQNLTDSLYDISSEREGRQYLNFIINTQNRGVRVEKELSERLSKDYDF